MTASPVVRVNPELIPSPLLRERISDALRRLLAHVPDGPWVAEVDSSAEKRPDWSLRLRSSAEVMVLTIAPERQTARGVLRSVLEAMARQSRAAIDSLKDRAS